VQENDIQKWNASAI